MAYKKVRLALLQLSCTEDPSRNEQRTFKRIEEAAEQGAHVVLLQELFNTTYFCSSMDERYFDWAKPLPGPLTKELCELAKRHEVVIVAPYFERRAAGVYHNSLAVIDADGSFLGRYRKMHIPDDPGFYEKYYFTPGDGEYPVFETRYGKIGTLICWDQWYPEPARIAALQGADLLVYPTAIGTLPDEDSAMRDEFLEAWQTVQRSHAIANGCFVASINRTGTEGDITFWGHSFVAGPFGQIQAEAGGEEEVLVADIDLNRIEKQRQVWPFFRDRRIDSYSPILKRLID